MVEGPSVFGGIDFSGAREPLSNLWTVLGREQEGKLRIVSVRPHAFRADLAGYVAGGWRDDTEVDDDARILWGVDFPLGLPLEVGSRLCEPRDWESVLAWVADRAPEEVRDTAGDAARAARATDSGAMAPLDLRLFKQTVEGFRWLAELREEESISVAPHGIERDAIATLIEVYPSGSAQELGLPRRRTPSRPGEARARAAALRTFLTFDHPVCEALVINLEDAWDATIACLTAFLCRDDLDQPYRAKAVERTRIAVEGWIYRPPATVA